MKVTISEGSGEVLRTTTTADGRPEIWFRCTECREAFPRIQPRATPIGRRSRNRQLEDWFWATLGPGDLDVVCGDCYREGDYWVALRNEGES